MSIEFAEKIRRLPTYPTAGGYALGDEYAMLASNEAPYGPPSGVQEAVDRAMRIEDIHLIEKRGGRSGDFHAGRNA